MIINNKVIMLQLQLLLFLHQMVPPIMKSSGTSVTLSCVSTSDSSGSGAYVWNLGGQSVYVSSGLLA